MAKTGIGIVTCNRLERLRSVVGAIRELTVFPYELVVADDGSTDGTAEWCKENAIRIVTGENRGVCWNKNRALFALESMQCDPLLLIEDDSRPVQRGWDMHWRIATALWGHVSFAHPKIVPWQISGAGTAFDPIVNNKATAQCAAVSAILLRRLGYFDARFKGYGVGHAEWTTRAKRLGMGFRRVQVEAGKIVNANLYIHGGLVAEDAPTNRNRAEVARNQALFQEIKREAVYRRPWHTEAEREVFVQEQKSAKVNVKDYALVEAAAGDERGEVAAWETLRTYKRALERVLSEPKSFIADSRWLDSIATVTPVLDEDIVPWFSYAMIRFLRERVRNDQRVFEYGAGYSTLWWQRKAASVSAVETNQEWVGMVTPLLQENASVRHEPEATFVNSINAEKRPFDIIVVDGFDRPACARLAAQRLTARGVLVFDDTHRGEYLEAMDELKAHGFRELPMRSPSPMTPREKTTSIFYRQDNCLGI